MPSNEVGFGETWYNRYCYMGNDSRKPVIRWIIQNVLMPFYYNPLILIIYSKIIFLYKLQIQNYYYYYLHWSKINFTSIFLSTISQIIIKIIINIVIDLAKHPLVQHYILRSKFEQKNCRWAFKPQKAGQRVVVWLRFLATHSPERTTGQHTNRRQCVEQVKSKGKSSFEANYWNLVATLQVPMGSRYHFRRTKVSATYYSVSRSQLYICVSCKVW